MADPSRLRTLDEMGESIGAANGWYATCSVCGARTRLQDADGKVGAHLHIVDGNTMVMDRRGEGKTVKEEGRALFGGFPWCEGEGLAPLGEPTPEGEAGSVGVPWRGEGA